MGFALRVVGSSSATKVIQVQCVQCLAGQKNKSSLQEVQRRELAKQKCLEFQGEHIPCTHAIPDPQLV